MTIIDEKYRDRQAIRDEDDEMIAVRITPIVQRADHRRDHVKIIDRDTESEAFRVADLVRDRVTDQRVEIAVHRVLDRHRIAEVHRGQNPSLWALQSMKAMALRKKWRLSKKKQRMKSQRMEIMKRRKMQ